MYKQAGQECQIQQFSKVAKGEQSLKGNSLVSLPKSQEKAHSC